MVMGGEEYRHKLIFFFLLFECVVLTEPPESDTVTRMPQVLRRQRMAHFTRSPCRSSPHHLDSDMWTVGRLYCWKNLLRLVFRDIGSCIACFFGICSRWSFGAMSLDVMWLSMAARSLDASCCSLRARRALIRGRFFSAGGDKRTRRD